MAMPTAVTPTASASVVTPSSSSGIAQTKVLVHLARDDDAQLSQALDDIEGLLKHYRTTHQTARVEVVVNGGGLRLVRTDTSAFAARIQRLQRDYDNLTFAACQNTIDRLAREQGVSVRLLPGVITIDSGMAEIMRRQHQGWTYLQV
jgi:intracellular sulfur oxidation DsrE/DsrF family protein